MSSAAVQPVSHEPMLPSAPERESYPSGSRRTHHPTAISRYWVFALPFAASGVNATVYFDRVRLASTRSGVPLALLLAHAIAHEMGHVLLKTNRHTRSNLMAETWSRTEFQLMQQGALAFDESEKARILERLEQKGCGCAGPGLNAGSHH